MFQISRNDRPDCKNESQKIIQLHLNLQFRISWDRIELDLA